uniref:Adhesion G protein-coupled receptor F5-like n=1 Tax=Leptobrachium leishanense TaxID=445787 RepID=A0A8C5MF21_9ANUR
MMRPSRIKYMTICLLLIDIFVGGMASVLQRPFLDTNDPPADTVTFWNTGEQNEERGYSRRTRRDVSAGVTQYAATIEISFSNDSLAAELKALLENIPIYIPVLSPSINITRANVSSVCHVNETIAICTCTDGYICTGNGTGSTCYCDAASDSGCCKPSESIEAFPSNPYIGDTLTVTCQFTGVVTDVSWYHNSSATKLFNSTKYIITDTILQVTDINWSDTGTYKCSAYVNSELRNLSTVVKVRSLNLISSADTDAVCNGTITRLSCCSGASNLFNVTWGMSGPILITGTESSNDTCHTYTLQPNNSQCPANLSLSVTVYTCQFQGINGAKGDRGIKVTYIREANVSIQTNSPVSVGSPLYINCITDVKSYNVTWAKDKLADDSLLKEQTNETITINNASLELNGTYFCTVHQKQVKNIASVDVRIVSLNTTTAPLNTTTTASTTTTTDSTITTTDLTTTTTASTTTTTASTTTSAPLPPLADIKVHPIKINIACKDTQTVKCCFSKNEQFTVTFTNSTNVDGPGAGACYVAPDGKQTQTPDGSNYIASCKRSDETGSITYTCNNTRWETNETCVSKKLFNLWVISESLSNISQIEITLPEFLQDLSDLSLLEKNKISGSQENIKLLLKIISTVSDPKINVTVNESTTQHYINAVDVLVQNSTAWQNITYLGSQVLQAVENFTLKIKNGNFNTNTSNPNVQLQQRTLSSSQTYNADFSLGDLTGNVAINKDALPSSNTTITSVAYSTMKDILPPIENTSLNGLVISTKIKERKDFSNFDISLSFKMDRNSLIEPQCVYWDFTQNQSIGWNNKSCSPTIQKDVVICNCNHLTSFTVLMSGKSELYLEIITYIGVGISIASLVITLIIEYIVWRSVIKNKTSYLRHVCLVNIAVSLLIADIWLMIGVGLEKYPRSDACIAGAFFSFYFYLALFFWMLATGLLLFHRMIFTLQDLSRKTLMITAFSLGYGCPLIIAVVTVASTAPRYVFTSGKFCWLNYEKTESMSFLAFVVPALTIVFINFIIMLVVISKLLRPSVGERPGNEEKFVLNQIAKSVTVLTPLLGLTWGFGLGLLFHPQDMALNGIFAILNSLQGLFILISTVLLDKKVRNTVKDSISWSNWSTRKTRLRSSSNFSTPSSRLNKRPGPKKGGYNFYKGNSSSNDTSNTFSSS